MAAAGGTPSWTSDWSGEQIFGQFDRSQKEEGSRRPLAASTGASLATVVENAGQRCPGGCFFVKEPLRTEKAGPSFSPPRRTYIKPSRHQTPARRAHCPHVETGRTRVRRHFFSRLQFHHVVSWVSLPCARPVFVCFAFHDQPGLLIVFTAGGLPYPAPLSAPERARGREGVFRPLALAAALESELPALGRPAWNLCLRQLPFAHFRRPFADGCGG
jgi:hypothetical protein